MSKRTDLHRPSVIVPSDYYLVACDYYGLGGAEGFAEDRAIFRAHMEKTGGKFVHIERDSGGCDVCGAHCSYVAKFYHVPSNSYIVTGMDCAAKMEIGDERLFASFKKRVAAGLKVFKGKAKARQILTDAGMTDVLALYDATRASLAGWDSEKQGDWWGHLTWEQQVTDEMFGKLVKYGSLSEKQMALLAKLPAAHAAKVAKKAAWEAERAAKHEAAAPLPVVETRVTVQGVIQSCKGVDTQFGYQWKMVVEHADGWKVYGTVPNNLIDEVTAGPSSATTYEDIQKEIRTALVGKRVEFAAKIKASDRDPKFGFFNRPTKARFIEAALA